jgi:hypothetical protein
VLLSGKEGYARSDDEAISERIWDVRIYIRTGTCQISKSVLTKVLLYRASHGGQGGGKVTRSVCLDKEWVIREGSRAYLGKDAILLAGHLSLLHGLPDAVVATLHQPPLQADGVAQEAVGLDAGAVRVAGAEALKLAVEDIVTTLSKQQKQVQPSHLVAGGVVAARG